MKIGCNDCSDNLNEIKIDGILFQISNHAKRRMSDREISHSKLNEYCQNLIISDDWQIWLNFHTTKDGWFDHLYENKPRYMIYDPSTKMTSFMAFLKINKYDERHNQRRVKIITIFHGRPVSQSKKNIKRNKFYSLSKPFSAQSKQLRIPYFDIKQGIKEITNLHSQ